MHSSDCSQLYKTKEIPAFNKIERQQLEIVHFALVQNCQKTAAEMKSMIKG